MTRLVSTLLLAALIAAVGLTTLTPTQAADPESARVKTVRDKVLTAKLKLDIDKKMLRAIITDDLPAAIKEATNVTIKIEPAPGQGVTLTSSFGPFKGEMTTAEVLDQICADKSWGWYVHVGKPGDQKDGEILITTNGKEHGYKEGTGPGGKEVAKKDEPKGKTKEKEKDDTKSGGGSDKEAAELLSKAKVQVQLKQADKAKETLNQIIEKYPDSKQAADAKKLLEKIGQ